MILSRPEHRASIIVNLIKKYDYKCVLEIGVRGGPVPQVIFEHLKWSHINYDGVDPDEKASHYVNHRMTSDEFFANQPDNIKWDLIFIDGLHVMEQGDKDLKNSFKHLNDGGTIVMHDCSPPTKYHTRPIEEWNRGEWNGDVWKSYVKLRMTRPDLFMCVINTDFGVGIIQQGKQKVYDEAVSELVLEYEYFADHRKEVLNLISVDEFVEMFELGDMEDTK